MAIDRDLSLVEVIGAKVVCGHNANDAYAAYVSKVTVLLVRGCRDLLDHFGTYLPSKVQVVCGRSSG